MSATSRRWAAVTPSKSSLESLDSLAKDLAISGYHFAPMVTALNGFGFV